MKFQLWTICQAEQYEYRGIKPLVGSQGVCLFLTKEAAREYLADVIKGIKHDITIGFRPKDNLNKKNLDFLIMPVFANISDKPMKLRGWKIPSRTEIQKRVMAQRQVKSLNYLNAKFGDLFKKKKK